jgi:hypothetical protein
MYGVTVRVKRDVERAPAPGKKGRGIPRSRRTGKVGHPFLWSGTESLGQLPSKTIFQNFLNISAALENGGYVQGPRVGPVDDEIRIDREELDRFVREILAPVTDAWSFGERHDLVANCRFNTICDLLAAFFLM